MTRIPCRRKDWWPISLDSSYTGSTPASIGSWYQIEDWKHSTFFWWICIGSMEIKLSQVSKKGWVSCSLCVMASTQPILNRNISLSKKIQKAGACCPAMFSRLLWNLQQPQDAKVVVRLPHSGTYVGLKIAQDGSLGMKLVRLSVTNFWFIAKSVEFPCRSINSEINWHQARST